MGRQNDRATRRHRRQRGIRKRVIGNAESPRLSVFRSHKHIYAQIVDDEAGVTLCSASTLSKDVRDTVPYGGNIVAAKAVGAALAERAKSARVQRVCFDRGGYRYHGRLKALADAAREGGLVF
ncbi:MAG: 50S ribosomal protein L18 [Planctomycetes bacterium]|nr:50S ribosomal protein L18 [Planctomycetota bacterium]MCH8250995.1 50S ribosomal protein L18 [Planctomycetota bacterium]